MARFVFADDGIDFDGHSIDKGPLGGVESSLINLTKELAKLGHEVLVRNHCQSAQIIDGVNWAPLSHDMPSEADVFVANRGDQLITLMPNAGQTIFWTHNPAKYLIKHRYLYKIWRYQPIIVFIGDYHASTYPMWAPGRRRKTIHYGISAEFMNVPQLETPPSPRAIFTSNPLRSLSWLLEIWEKSIWPLIPQAEFHLFTGSKTYGKVGQRKSSEMASILGLAERLKDKGVVIRGPVAKSQLVQEFKESRVMLYRGDVNETFCLALGESQAAGVPAIVQDYGSTPERVKDGQTGFITKSDEDFATAAISLLKDDQKWREFHLNCQEQQRHWGWREVAQSFEGFIPK